MEFSSHLDNVTASFEQCDLDSWQRPNDPLIDDVEEIDAIRPYSKSWRLGCGAIFSWSLDPRQGSRIDLGGLALQALRNHDLSWSGDGVLFWLANHPQLKRLTRVDYCVNVHGGKHHPTNTYWHFQRGKYIGTAKAPEIDDRRLTSGGYTVYYGTPQSDKRVRIYDKAAEQDLLLEAWTRVEAQIRKPYADKFAADILEHGLSISGRSWIRSIADFPALGWYQQALAGDTITPRNAREKQDKFWHYVNEYVAKWIIQRMESGDVELGWDFAFNIMQQADRIRNSPSGR